MVKKASESSRREGQRKRRESGISGKIAAELAALEVMPDDEIDTSDIPERLDWTNAEVGKFYRPIKKLISLRVDADVLDWFQSRAKQYTPMMNQGLRAYIAAEEARKTKRARS